MNRIQNAFFDSISRAKVLDPGIGFNSKELLEKSKRQALARAELLGGQLVTSNNVEKRDFRKIENTVAQSIGPKIEEKIEITIESDLPEPPSVNTSNLQNKAFGTAESFSFGRSLGAFVVDSLLFLCFFSLVYIVSQVLPFPKSLVHMLDSARMAASLEFFQTMFLKMGIVVQISDVFSFVFSYICFAVFESLCGLIAGCTLGQSFFSLSPLASLQKQSPVFARTLLFLYLPAVFLISFGRVLVLPLLLLRPKSAPYFFA